MGAKLLTAELTAKIAGYLEAGHGGTEAARLAGIGRTTYYEWLQRARDDEQAGQETLYTAFAERVAEAEAKLEETQLSRIQAAAETPKGWTAAAWLLERRFPSRWSLRGRLELAGADGEPVTVLVKFAKTTKETTADDAERDPGAPEAA